ncbi:MAG: hypothetical protein FWG73_01695 [Planctomycetaceae bacterium]|nr:hypothetical protein [Planctomycetaceae bacterium]
MKQSFILVPCIAAMLVFSHTANVQAEDASSVLSVANIIAEPESQYALPFGCPPYPSVDGMPAYGVPYSYARVRQPRRLGSRLAPPAHHAYPLPAPGVTPGYTTQFVAPPMVAPPMTKGRIPARQEMLAVPAIPGQPEQPTVFYRPTPVRNFMSLIVAPRPYVGYDPYAVYPVQ